MNDELMHSVGDDPAWSESYYFNFIDPDTKFGMFTRMGFRPGNGWVDALHVIYLGGHRVAFTYGRRAIESDLTQYDGDLNAGQLTLTCVEPHKLWRIHYDGPAQDIADAEILLTRSKQRPDGWFTPQQLQMDLTFECLTDPHYAAQGSHGHFEQSGHVKGRISMGNEEWLIAGYGVRDKSWGPRDWGAGNQSTGVQKKNDSTQPQPFVNWFSLNFADYAAMGGSCFRHDDGSMRGAGWLQKDGESQQLENVLIETVYKPDSIIHQQVKLTAETAAGESIVTTGNVLSVCPTKIAMPGGATFVNEGLTEFDWDGRKGFGIAEHWHSVTL